MSALRNQRSGALQVTAPRSGVAGDRSGRGDAFTGASAAAFLFELHTTYLRPAPRASAGTGRGVPAHATQITAPAWEAGAKEENHQ